MASRGQQGARAALEVDDAALPAGARQALGDRADEAGVGVADDEPRAGEPAFAQEPEPARVGLGVDGRDAGHAAHPVGADADGGGNRRGLHPAVPPALDVGGVQDNVGEPRLPRGPGRPAVLPLRPSTCASCWPGPSRASLYPLPGDPLHLPRRDAVGPRLRDGRRGGAVRARVPLDQALREMCPRAQLGDAQRDVARGVSLWFCQWDSVEKSMSLIDDFRHDDPGRWCAPFLPNCTALRSGRVWHPVAHDREDDL